MRKSTVISGYKAGYVELTAPFGTTARWNQDTANDAYAWSISVPGHWSDASAVARARRAGGVGQSRIVHLTYDHKHLVTDRTERVAGDWDVEFQDRQAA